MELIAGIGDEQLFIAVFGMPTVFVWRLVFFGGAFSYDHCLN